MGSRRRSAPISPLGSAFSKLMVYRQLTTGSKELEELCGVEPVPIFRKIIPWILKANGGP